MNLVLEIIFIITLGVLFYQDIKERKVSVWILLIGMFLGGMIHYLHQPPIVFLSNVGVNSVFIILILGILWMYSKFKLKKKILDVFGGGDALFFILLALSLPILSFLMVFVFSLIFSLLVFMILKNLFKHSVWKNSSSQAHLSWGILTHKTHPQYFPNR